MFDTLIEVKLCPVQWNTAPTICVGINDELAEHVLSSSRWFVYNLNLPAKPARITVKFFGKTNEDTTATQDKAVIIEEIKLNGISDPKFIWAGKYYPDYPEPWASEQKDLPLTIPGATYMGWNGTWTLDITVPVFTWIHQVRGLGWLYD